MRSDSSDPRSEDGRCQTCQGAGLRVGEPVASGRLEPCTCVLGRPALTVGAHVGAASCSAMIRRLPDGEWAVAFSSGIGCGRLPRGHSLAEAIERLLEPVLESADGWHRRSETLHGHLGRLLRLCDDLLRATAASASRERLRLATVLALDAFRKDTGLEDRGVHGVWDALQALRAQTDLLAHEIQRLSDAADTRLGPSRVTARVGGAHDVDG